MIPWTSHAEVATLLAGLVLSACPVRRHPAAMMERAYDAQRVSSEGHGRTPVTRRVLYVRQSTIRQVFENTESTTRQYALRERAVALGWPVERVHVIDTDLGQSGATADREGFQRLVTESGSAARALCWDWRSRASRAIRPIGIGFSSSARCPTRSSSMRMACATPPTLTTACSWV